MLSVIYNRYRPRKFSDFVGQEAPVRILQGSIKAGARASYIFYGPRGTGKTSAARVFGAVLNCENETSAGNFEPCGDCRWCKPILSGGSNLAVSEIDAAGSRGISDAKRLLEHSVHAPPSGGRRFFIIDEAHMLTKEAFNVLLKAIEEPYAFVTFVLVTTEFTSIPQTIISRSLTIFFRPVTPSAIMKRLVWICEQEDIAYEKEALSFIAEISEGSVRDSLSILQNFLVTGDLVTTKLVREYFGSVAPEESLKMLFAILRSDLAGLFEAVNKVLSTGVQPATVLNSVLGSAKELLFWFSNLPGNYESSEKYLSDLFESVLITPPAVDCLINKILNFLRATRIVNRPLLEVVLLSLCREFRDRDLFVDWVSHVVKGQSCYYKDGVTVVKSKGGRFIDIVDNESLGASEFYIIRDQSVLERFCRESLNPEDLFKEEVLVKR